MSLPGLVPGMPRVGTRVNAAHRIVFRQGTMVADLAGGKIISGATSRDAGNTGDLDVLRPGKLMGKITSTSEYAPSILGVTTGTHTAGGTTLTVGAATLTELVRRVGASGTFRIIGPPTANGIVAEEAVTYSAAATTTITITAITNDYISGAFIVPDDGSEDILTIIPDGWGVKVTDVDNSTSLDVPFSPFPLGGILTSSLIIDWPSDTSLRTWLMGQMARQGAGKFIFDHVF